ncbi:hypothetical protein [Massilia horti]|uniref:Uncharacterized protein n=1 Tax=Massilia horti TaxID=2562153 RepID=A0A4Y9T1U6_9BURK|nr:hypothetical protein [Massilia horti]TFW31869.1 hypothetical protein E4O92_12140 [Massilia horti]
MFGLFKRGARQAELDTPALGATVIALPMPVGCSAPNGCAAVIINASGRTRRAEGKLALGGDERAYCFHPGPYQVDLVPFAAAPEIGLRVAFAIDSPDPHAVQQRFDLFLASEAAGQVELAAFAKLIEAALQRELAQGNLALPPCTQLDEWNAFRAGFNQLLFMRFGVTVDDCLPVDLGEHRDFAALLKERVLPDAPPAEEVTAPACVSDEVFDPTIADAGALRRLFLELPCVMCQLRMAGLPPGQELFRMQQELLQRLDLVSLSAGTMPALGLSGPGQPLAPALQLRRARHSRRATAALDEAWALLARLERAHEGDVAELFDEAGRIIANLEHDMAARRGTTEAAEEDA